MEATVDFKFDDKDNATSAHVKMSIKLDEEPSDSEVEALKSSMTSSGGYSNVSVKKDGSTVYFEADMDPKELGTNSDVSYETIKKNAADNDFTCK